MSRVNHVADNTGTYGETNMADTKSVFTRTNRAPKKEVRGQAETILAHLDSVGFTTIEAAAKNIGAEALRTRQDPERVVAYYFCIFKKQGLVTVSRPVVEEPAAETVEAAAE
jgi:hypothetical protein